ncbi:MAG TPA: hypothetical protein DCG54_08465 [Anaerolineae bacterium]|jgi:hypothetical protein|nr:hypothetical protein [Anaerolineae bacterium]
MQKQPQFIAHDGSSQAGRTLKALDPAYVAVDERSIKDLLAFAQKYAAELRYFNEQNKADGDWSRFLGENDLDEIVAYMNDPQLFDGNVEKEAQFNRPHLTLFLTFLELLQIARAQLNDLTRRHLEFYYREALRLTSRNGLPDRVHTLVELADKQEQFLLPAGTVFQAGQDAKGQAILFRSDEDLLANRATVGSIKSLFAEKKIIGIREARKTPDVLIELSPSNEGSLGEGKQTDRSFIAMLMMALGTPLPGAKLEPYPNTRSVDAALLGELDTLLDFVPTTLYMPFSTFRSLMQLKGEQAIAYAQWSKVNDTLEAAARIRLNDPDFILDKSEPANFEKNLLAALGRATFGDLYNELPEVEDIYGVYRRRDREDVVEFIGKSLFMSVEAFSVMMGIVEEINGRWRQVYEILRAAGRKKQLAHPEHELKPPTIRTYEADKFNALVQRTLGAIDYASIQGARPASFDECHAKIIELENYFQLSAEKFVFIRKINASQENAQPWEWEQVYGILEDAHRAKTLVDRRNTLKTKREKESFQAMILFALGDPDPGNDLPLARKFEKLDPVQDKDYLLEQLFLEPVNYTYIRMVQGKAKNATAEEWVNIYTILELAQRRKRKWTETPAEIEKWENIYVAPDATQVQVRMGAEGEDVTPRWRTFGKGYSPDLAYSTPGDIGFAIASPLLALAEGKRTITLTLAFHEKGFDKDLLQSTIQPPSPFQFLLSTEKEMLAIDNVTLQLLDAAASLPGAEKPYPRALQITLVLDERAPAVAPMASETGIQTPWPVLQLKLANLPPAEGTQGGPQKRYRAFQHLALEKIHIKVEVEGITQLTLQNDSGVLDSKKPFEPFGLSPVSGSSFYIAHPELCSKKLDQLNFKFEWLGAPDNFSTYYLGYLKSDERETDPTGDLSTSPISDNTNFAARLKLFDNRSFFEISSIQLFNANKNKKTEGASQASLNAITIGYPGYKRDIQPASAEDVLNWPRYWQLELLSPDFQHSIYPRVAAGCANKIIKGSGADPKPKPYIINQPYTPKIKRLTLGYSAFLEIDLTKIDFNQQIDRLYHIDPFGYRDLAGYVKQPHSFLPNHENEGELFIGIKTLTPPQDISLLFQLAEGSADPSLDREPVHWSFLDGNNWHSLEKGRLLSDSTNGLLNSGIIKFSLAPVQPGSLLPSDQYWLRATIARNSRSVADIIAIQTQAVSATFENHNNDPGRLAQPLAAGRISGLADPHPQVKAIHQPFSSFGGKSPEQPGSFHTRVSERLRHKNRALTSWDYERMVLEAFPSIYKVKCLPVGTSQDPRLADVIQIVVIPDIQGKLPFDPFEPKLPADVLGQIEQYLIKHSPLFARLQVKNPTYVRLKARLGIRLRPDANPGYYKNLLNQELQRYLAPWAYDRGADIFFGGKINASLIVNFIEERPYVDYVAGIKLFTSLDGLNFIMYDELADTQLDEVSVFAADAILVSDRSHEIDLIAEEGYEQEFFTGINYMKIELDFQIAAK